MDGTVSQQTADISGLMTDVTNLENKNTEQDQSIAANASAIEGKVSIDQGVVNSGKALVVGSDGNVALGDISSGEVWEEVNLNEFPRDWVPGELIRIDFKVSFSNDRYVIPNDSASSIIEVTLINTSSTIITNKVISFSNPSGIFSFVTLAYIDGSKFNGGTGTIMSLRALNATSTTGNVNLNSAQLPNYIRKMWRRRP